jgi:thiol:disulfide interchange protein DsbC
MANAGLKTSLAGLLLAMLAGTAVGQTDAGAKAAAKPAAKPQAAAPAATEAAPQGAAGNARKAAEAKAEGDVRAEIRRQLEARFPGAEIRHVGRTPYLGLYEVLMDGQMIYTDSKVSLVFVGNLYDPVKRQNLTQERMQDLTAVKWSDLPLDLAFKTVKGNGSRKLAVFSDVDCPFCKRLEEELKNVNDVTIYTFLFPIDSLHPDAGRKSKLVWCSSDRQKAFDELMQKGVVPSSRIECDDPVAKIVALGEKLRIQATPTMIFADGRIVPGALPKAQLEAQLARAEANLKARPN